MITLYQVIYSQHLLRPTHAPGWTSSINMAGPTHTQHRTQVQDTTLRTYETGYKTRLSHHTLAFGNTAYDFSQKFRSKRTQDT